VIIVMANGQPRKGVIHKAMKDVTEADALRPSQPPTTVAVNR
jgi:hypothetical protein